MVVASNLFGDILTDLSAAVTGTIGLAPSGNINPEREFPRMFEPVHGSAPDIAGQDRQPAGGDLVGAQMLDHLGEPEAAAAALRALEEMLASDGPVRPTSVARPPPRTSRTRSSQVSPAPEAASAPSWRRRRGSLRGDALERLAQVGTYRTLGEQKLSPQEERFEKARRTVGLFLAPAVFLIFYLLPLDMDETQQKLAAALLFVVVLWISEAVPIPIGGLLGIALIVLIGVAPVDDVLAPFGSSTVFVFIGAFIIAQAMLRHGLARRFAFRVLAVPGVGKSTVRTIVAFGVITCLLSAFVSNTATVAMLLPTAIAILGTLANIIEDKTDRPGLDPTKLRVGIALMLMLAYGASVGGLLTPVGSPPNLIGRGLIEEATDERISFLEWVLAALPICAAMFVVLCVVLLLLNKPEVRRLEGVEDYVEAERSKMGPLSRKEKNTLIAFGVAVILWIVPGIVAIVAGDESQTYSDVTDRLDEGIVAIVAASLLFLLPTNWERREFTLTWNEAKDIDWGTILLFGSGIIFGSLLQDSGLAETIGTWAPTRSA